MSDRQAIEATDLRVLGYFVRKHLSLTVPDDFIDEVLDQAQRGNGPAEYIVGSWWEVLSYDAQAHYWYSLSAGHNHAPALAKLRRQAAQSDVELKKRIAG